VSGVYDVLKTKYIQYLVAKEATKIRAACGIAAESETGLLSSLASMFAFENISGDDVTKKKVTRSFEWYEPPVDDEPSPVVVTDEPSPVAKLLGSLQKGLFFLGRYKGTAAWNRFVEKKLVDAHYFDTVDTFADGMALLTVQAAIVEETVFAGDEKLMFALHELREKLTMGAEWKVVYAPFLMHAMTYMMRNLPFFLAVASLATCTMELLSFPRI
jgi:hypothetical protein